jgi:hypothetical protein
MKHIYFQYHEHAYIEGYFIHFIILNEVFNNNCLLGIICHKRIVQKVFIQIKSWETNLLQLRRHYPLYMYTSIIVSLSSQISMIQSN